MMNSIEIYITSAKNAKSDNYIAWLYKEVENIYSLNYVLSLRLEVSLFSCSDSRTYPEARREHTNFKWSINFKENDIILPVTPWIAFYLREIPLVGVFTNWLWNRSRGHGCSPVVDIPQWPDIQDAGHPVSVQKSRRGEGSCQRLINSKRAYQAGRARRSARTQINIGIVSVSVHLPHSLLSLSFSLTAPSLLP